jgi:hypothetical protein
LRLPHEVCGECSSCPVKCQNGWSVGGKIRDIVRLKNLPWEFLA